MQTEIFGNCEFKTFKRLPILVFLFGKRYKIVDQDYIISYVTFRKKFYLMNNKRRIDMKKWLKILLWSVGTLIVGLGIGYALLCYVINDLFKTIFGG